MSTSYAPTNIDEFSSKALNFNGVGIEGVGQAGQTTNIDYQVTDDSFLTGAILLTKTSKFGDNFIFQVIDKDGILAPAGTVLKQFITDWSVSEDVQKQIDMQINYPAKIYAGLYLRFIYKSSGLIDVKIAINYTLHKILF